MTTLPQISSPAIRPGLLRLDAMRREGRAKPLECIWGAYDIIATAWVKAGAKLTEADLALKIPELVFEAAVEFNWLDYPRRRRTKRVRSRPDSWIPNAPTIDWVDVLIPEAELIENIGRFKVEAGVKDDFVNRLLGGRLSEWRAKLYDVEEENIAPVPKVSAHQTGKPINSAIGPNIDRLREECGWSFDDLAEQSGVDKTLIMDHIHRRAKPHPRNLKRYAEAFSRCLERPVTVGELKS